jgi:hypothetical protein
VSRASLFRKERRRRGLCAVAGCPVVTGDRSYRCHAHAEAHRGAVKLAYQAELARRLADVVADVEDRAAGAAA